jgi:hypothetical protein
MLLRNVASRSTDYMALYLRRWQAYSSGFHMFDLERICPLSTERAVDFVASTDRDRGLYQDLSAAATTVPLYFSRSTQRPGIEPGLYLGWILVRNRIAC